MSRRHTIDIATSDDGKRVASVIGIGRQHAERLVLRATEFGELDAGIVDITPADKARDSQLGKVTVYITENQTGVPDNTVNAWDNPRLSKAAISHFEKTDPILTTDFVAKLVGATAIDTDRQTVTPLQPQQQSAQPTEKPRITEEDIANAMAVYGD